MLEVFEEQKRCHCGRNRMGKGMRIRDSKEVAGYVELCRPWYGI